MMSLNSRTSAGSGDQPKRSRHAGGEGLTQRHGLVQPLGVTEITARHQGGKRLAYRPGRREVHVGNPGREPVRARPTAT